MYAFVASGTTHRPSALTCDLEASPQLMGTRRTVGSPSAAGNRSARPFQGELKSGEFLKSGEMFTDHMMFTVQYTTVEYCTDYDMAYANAYVYQYSMYTVLTSSTYRY